MKVVLYYVYPSTAHWTRSLLQSAMTRVWFFSRTVISSTKVEAGPFFPPRRMMKGFYETFRNWTKSTEVVNALGVRVAPNEEIRWLRINGVIQFLLNNISHMCWWLSVKILTSLDSMIVLTTVSIVTIPLVISTTASSIATTASPSFFSILSSNSSISTHIVRSNSMSRLR